MAVVLNTREIDTKLISNYWCEQAELREKLRQKTLPLNQHLHIERVLQVFDDVKVELTDEQKKLLYLYYEHKDLQGDYIEIGYVLGRSTNYVKETHKLIMNEMLDRIGHF